VVCILSIFAVLPVAVALFVVD